MPVPHPPFGPPSPKFLLCLAFHLIRVSTSSGALRHLPLKGKANLITAFSFGAPSPQGEGLINKGFPSRGAGHSAACVGSAVSAAD